jgi:hypothetical protein
MRTPRNNPPRTSAFPLVDLKEVDQSRNGFEGSWKSMNEKRAEPMTQKFFVLKLCNNCQENRFGIISNLCFLNRMLNVHQPEEKTS